MCLPSGSCDCRVTAGIISLWDTTKNVCLLFWRTVPHELSGSLLMAVMGNNSLSPSLPPSPPSLSLPLSFPSLLSPACMVASGEKLLTGNSSGSLQLWLVDKRTAPPAVSLSSTMEVDGGAVTSANFNTKLELVSSKHGKKVSDLPARGSIMVPCMQGNDKLPLIKGQNAKIFFPSSHRVWWGLGRVWPGMSTGRSQAK